MLRGEYDPERIRRLAEPFRRALARAREAMAGEPPDAPPPLPDRTLAGTLHRLALVGLVVGLAALMLALAALPGAAVAGRLARALVSKLDAGPTELNGISLKIAQRSVVYAAGGEVIATLAGEENRTVVPLERVPEVAQRAVLAIEDASFYEHRGVSLGGLVRALFTNLEAGTVRQGGSTITQQLVKNVIVGNERSLDRKIREARYAIALERERTKREILELYLNEAYFGNGVYGIGTAAEFYFGTKVDQLTLAQSALLAGLIRAPERYDPLRHAEAARARRNLVLDRMAELGHITRAEAARAKAEPLGAAPHPLPAPVEPYFVEFVKEQILSDPRFGATRADRARALFQGGLRIHTTLDLRLQRAAAAAVSQVLTSPNDPAAALVAIDPATGAVKAMVGGRDFEKNKYNLAVQGRRQAGSSFKPFTLVAALESGVPPGYTLDTPSPIEITDQTGQVWRVENYSHRGEGIMDLRRATELSVNSFYAQLIAKVGPARVVEVARKMGITSDLQPYLSLALGTFEVSPYEMASAYATLAAGGVHCQPYAVTRIVDASGRTVVENDPDCSPVLDPEVAAQATAILRGVIERGTGRARARIGRPAAGKTGTTDDYKDAWFTGYTPQLATAVWMGYPKDRSRPLTNIHGFAQVFGGSLPAMIWARFMRAAHEGLPVVDFPPAPPPRMVAVPDVVGRSFEEARAALDALGFSVRRQRVASSYAAGVVASESPAAGTEVEAGTIVTLGVSDGSGGGEPPPGPGPSPEPSASPSPEPTPA
jgi:penicillin-binding protein 1A